MTRPDPNHAAPAPGSGSRITLPAILLIAANLIPLWGVFSWGWQVFEVAALYWLENVVVGVINVLKMLSSSPNPEKLNLIERIERRGKARDASPEQIAKARDWLEEHQSKVGRLYQLAKLFFVPFFIVHYGMFTLVHGMFVVFMLGGDRGGAESESFGGSPMEILPGLANSLLTGGAAWGAAALALSHLVSFMYHHFICGEFRTKTLDQLMMAPYGRVVVLHLAILGGGFAIASLGSPLPLLVILVVGKTIIDLSLHRKSHRGGGSRPQGLP